MKLSIKRFSALFAFVCCSFAVLAADYKGACGNNATWEFSSGGTLYINGGGEIWDFGTSYSERVPWYDYRSSITKVVIGNRITRIGDYTFYGLQKLYDVTIPNSVTSIGDGAFDNCAALSYISIPESVQSLGTGCFVFSGLAEIKIPNSIRQIANDTFKYCENLRSVVIGDGVESIGKSAFSDCTALTSVKFGANVKSVGESAFYRCTSLSSVSLNEGLIEIGGSAFYKCNLRNLVIPNSVVSLGSTTFYENSKLEHVQLGESVSFLDGNLFTYCSKLSEINLPQSIKSISAGAFRYCNSLRRITSTIPADSLFTLNSGTFSDEVYTYCTLKVPFGAKDAYSTKGGWKNFKKIVEIRNDYQVRFMVDGVCLATDTITEGDSIVLPEVPAKEGYTFGWGNIPDMMPSGDIVVSGSYVPYKYLVIFTVDGEVVASDSLEYGVSIIVPETPEKEGYTFSGWGEVDEVVPAHNVTYEGSYFVNSYLLTYVVDGETVRNDSVAYGTPVTMLEEPTKEGYTFSGWSEIPAAMPAGDVTVIGTFAINKYLVTFTVDGEVVASDSLEYGASIIIPEMTEKEGYTFSGWGEVDATVPAHDMAYEGSYSVNSYLLTFVVDGETVQSDSIAYGTTITMLETPTKEGYTFNGWGEVPTTMPAEDMTISGFFTVNTYKVYYYVGEEVVYTEEVPYGEAIPEYVYKPTVERDEFLGWIGETYETMPAHDVTYTANIESGIGEVENSKLKIENSVIYDFCGRKIVVDDLRELQKGTYIINGRKVVVK